MSANPVLWNLDARGVATVTLNRPEVNNAYDAGLIGGVLAAMDELGRKPSLRVVVLKGNGKHFQAGADLKWINAVRPQSPAENEAVSRATFEAVQRLNRLPVPTVALVQGGCFGGGLRPVRLLLPGARSAGGSGGCRDGDIGAGKRSRPSRRPGRVRHEARRRSERQQRAAARARRISGPRGQHPFCPPSGLSLFTSDLGTVR